MGCWPFSKWITADFFLGFPRSGRIFDASRPTCAGSERTRQIEIPLPAAGRGGRGARGLPQRSSLQRRQRHDPGDLVSPGEQAFQLAPAKPSLKDPGGLVPPGESASSARQACDSGRSHR